jgi:hypothetical protein
MIAIKKNKFNGLIEVISKIQILNVLFLYKRLYKVIIRTICQCIFHDNKLVLTKYFLAGLIILSSIACKNNEIVKVEEILNELIGKTIQFPDIESTIPYVRKDTFDKYAFNSNNEYKLLLYTDSSGCTNCKLRIHIWKSYIKELHDKVNFLFYFHPKNEEELMFTLKEEKFTYPVYIDRSDNFNKLNKLPSDIQYQCFLLNAKNEIISVGNPVHNYGIWELYKQIVSGEISVKIPVTVVKPQQTEIVMNDLKTKKTSTAIFVLENTGDQPLIIKNVETSCGCTVPQWDKQPVGKGKTVKIKVNVTPDSQGYFNKSIIVYCNTDKGLITLLVKGMVL